MALTKLQVLTRRPLSRYTAKTGQMSTLRSLICTNNKMIHLPCMQQHVKVRTRGPGLPYTQPSLGMSSIFGSAPLALQHPPTRTLWNLFLIVFTTKIALLFADLVTVITHTLVSSRHTLRWVRGALIDCQLAVSSNYTFAGGK